MIAYLYSGIRNEKSGQAFVVVETLGCDPSQGLELPVCDVHWLNKDGLICRTNRYRDNSDFTAK